MSTEGPQRRASVYISHSYYIRIASAFIGLLAITVLVVLYHIQNSDNKIISNFKNDLISHVSTLVIEKSTNYFLPASMLVNMSASLCTLGALSCNDFDQIELYTLGTLKYYKQISMFYLADERGSYIRAWSLPDNTMEGRIIKPYTVPPTDTFKYWDSEFKLTKTRVSNNIEYDPRVRPWYVGAKQARGCYWTDLYILFRNKKPAITCSCPVIDPDGRIGGVWAIDIELDEISTFLKSLKIGKSGIAFIINEKNEVVAYPEMSRFIREENGTVRPVRVEELGVESVSAAFREYAATGGRELNFESGGVRYFASISDFPKSFPVTWKIALIVPERDFVAGAMEEMHRILLVCAAILAIAVILAAFIARGITRPIRLLAEETGRIKDFHLEDRGAITSYIKEIQLMSSAVSAMKKGLQAFRRYVPAELVRQLIKTGKEARIGGQKEELTVMFSDIKGFTTIAERTNPEDLIHQLSEYFDELTKILSDNRGTVDKYIGDGILAFWGAPIQDDENAVNACRAGLACRDRIAELNRNWQSEGKSPFITRIGISTGETLVGNVGSSERMNYTVMGDNVNLASRLEGANKLYGTQVIVDRRTCESASEEFLFRLLGRAALRGRSGETTIYELVGKKTGDEADANAAICTAFTRGVEAYLAREWDEAFAIFSDLSAHLPEDAPTGFYLERCRQYRNDPPGEDWRGVEKRRS